MGREIRYVSAHWEHPRTARGEYQPIHNKDMDTAMVDWRSEIAAESAYYDSEAECIADLPPPTKYPDFYRPTWTEEEANWVQAYETISEGTPVSPAFSTKEELGDWLLRNGDFYSSATPTRASVEKFLQDEWAPSFVSSGGYLTGWEEQGDLGVVMDPTSDASSRQCLTRTANGSQCRNTVKYGSEKCAAGHTVTL